MPLSTVTIFGRQVMNQVTAADYVEWATGMLVDGFDSPTLRMLAGFDERGSTADAEIYFRRALRELQILEPDTEGKLRAYGVDIANQILDGRLSPEEGVPALMFLFSGTTLEHPGGDWLNLECLLYDLQDGDRRDVTPEVFAGMVKAEAQRFIEKMSHEKTAQKNH
jgi:hypothetical protein